MGWSSEEVGEGGNGQRRNGQQGPRQQRKLGTGHTPRRVSRTRPRGQGEPLGIVDGAGCRMEPVCKLQTEPGAGKGHAPSPTACLWPSWA